MQIEKIYIGGWFQRTTLHLSEIYNFIKYGKSELKFSKKKIDEMRKILQIKKISREIGPLEYISVKTKKEIDFRIYEDGLMILEKGLGVSFYAYRFAFRLLFIPDFRQLDF